MEWIKCFNQSIEYMEEHLLDVISTEQMVNQIAEQLNISQGSFRKKFQMMIGYSVGEYLKNRKLYEAACELATSNRKVVDIAMKYGYDTPDSFTKAFRRFHGITPTEARNRLNPIKQFLPLKIEISYYGGEKIDYSYEELDAFTLIGFESVFSYTTSYEKIPLFYKEIGRKYREVFVHEKEPTDEIEKAIVDNHIGEYSAVINDIGKDKFRYLIAGMYRGGVVPEGMVLHTFKSSGWLKFKCTGPNPDTIQRLNTQVFKKWLPCNTEYKVSWKYNIEWQPDGNSRAADYESGIWVPVKRRKK